MTKQRRLVALAGAATIVSTAALALAQGEASDGAATEGTEAPPPPAPAAPSTTTTYPYGLPAPGTDLNPGLGSSSRPVTDTSRAGDGFDLSGSGMGGAAVVRGGKDSPGILTSGVQVPAVHTVRRGDTLWDLCAQYHRNPWRWPAVWAQNPQIQNPHWIYPGDQIRMRTPETAAAGSRGGIHAQGGGKGSGGRIGSLVPPTTVFLREQGYLGDPQRDVWGKLVGAREEQVLLSEGNTVYLKLRKGVVVQIGQNLTVFRRVRTLPKVKGARQPPGELVRVLGTVRVDQFDPKTLVARGQLVESLDVVERGASVGPVGRRFDVVPPKPSEVTVSARVLSSIYPHVYFGQNQIVFIDRGSQDGLVPGNRLFVVRRGDTWRKTLEGTEGMGRLRLRMESEQPVDYEDTPLVGRTEDFPEEIVGEIRILRTEKYSSAALVTGSAREIVSGDRAVARKGY